MTFPRFVFILAVLALALGNAPARAEAPEVTTPVIIELANPAPTVVARWQAEQRGEVFDDALHRAKVRMAQDALLEHLLLSGVDYALGASTLASGLVREHRFTDVINAFSLDVRALDLHQVATAPNVRHVTREELQRLHLNNSVRYIRANGPDSARTAGVRGVGTVNSDGSASGQVIAILDTGLDHTNAMFDLRFDDSEFERRGELGGDARPPRLSGSPYQDGSNHPKVAYRYNVNTAPIAGDDTGHGTNSGTTAGGLLAKADTVVNNGEVVEGVAPGAVMMDYKVCPSLSCVTTLSLLAFEDCIQPFDDAGNPKPMCTVVNMSYGSDTGDPNSAGGIAAGNLQFAGVVPVASAGNSGPQENIVGSPSATRTVISVAATNDPGVSPNSIDQLDAGEAITATHLAFFAPESNGAQGNISTAIQGEYVDVGLGDTPDQYPAGAVAGRICLAKRGSTIDGGAAGTGLFANKANQCVQNGGVALVLYNDVPGQMGSVLAPSAIPVFTTSKVAGDAMIAALSGGNVSTTEIRINPADSNLFEPSTTGFSSRGPNNDYLVVKPDITAPGEEILMGASKIGALGNPSGFGPASGTSFSGPHIAGVAALVRDANARPDLSPSQVRAAMMNTATNLRFADGTEVANDDRRNFIHETGAGLVEVVEALNVAAIMGTNELNGTAGPDATDDPNFLPSYSFGERAWIGTGVAATDGGQQASITVTMANLQGGGGQYSLSIVDGGADRGDVTRPVTENGFSLSLSTNSVALGNTATFDVTVAVDGTSGGLAPAGADVNGAVATEFLWYLVADNGSERLRMPMYLRVVQGGAPVFAANDDSALTTPDTSVVIDVLANDTGEGLTVTRVDQPSNGSVADNGDGTVTYTPNPGYSGGDTFVYEVTDTNAATAEATVRVTVAAECAATGQFFADFETDNDGFSFDTPQEKPGSPNWSRVLDPLASTGSQSMFTDSNGLVGIKDDYLISPELLVSQDSQLVFYHRFKFSTTADGGVGGGVLEISTDGGASWVDIEAAGGHFVNGGYNGVMRPEEQSNPGVIPGRKAWTGFSQFIDANTPTTVNLAAFSGQTIQLRWRATLDNTIVLGDGGTGWWIQDVQVTFTGCDEPNLPPNANDDSAETLANTPVTIDLLANDSDPEGDTLTVDAVTQPANGSVVDNGDGTVTYTPAAGFTGTDTFTYAIGDGNNNSDGATVTVTVTDQVDPNPDDNGKVTGGGWIPDGDRKANFGFNAHPRAAGVKGQLQFHAKGAGVKIHGDITSLQVDGRRATFGGVCSANAGMTCEFEVVVEDNADSGRGADRFSIMITGGAEYFADELLGGGNIKIH